MQVQVLNGVLVANGAPTLITHGVPLFRSSRDMQFINPQLDGLYDNCDEAELFLKMTGTGALAISYIRAWGWFQVSKGPAVAATVPLGTDASDWAPLGTGTAADKGKLNGAAALAITGTNLLVHAERLRGLRELMRFYLEVGVVGGTVTTIDAWLIARGQAQ